MKANTLKYHKLRPLTRARDVSQVLMRDTIMGMNDFRQDINEIGMSVVAPEREAVSFYFWNHVLAALDARFENEEPLEEDVVGLIDSAYTESNLIFQRLFVYLMIICARESRHNHSSPKYDIIAKRWGVEIASVLKSLKSLHHSTAIETFLSSDWGTSTLGDYTQAVEYLLFKGKYGHAFGGKLWGEIAKAVRRFVHGKLSAELLADIAWALAHNTGPIFNKGITYKNQDNTSLYTVLDVQRAGMIPNLVWEYNNDSWNPTNHVTVKLAKYLDKVIEILGDDFATFVDWYAVEKDSTGKVSYYSYKERQVELYGLSTEHMKFKADQAAQIIADAEDKKKAKAKERKRYFTIMPNVKVKKDLEVIREHE